ncbi:MAG: 30S ribosomal protein S3 [Candidatus Aenigmarchaeota archaeon]|nr:30S ribosomal protein S3 [Candidatus Aenigmarchaeota archaeon]
MLTKSFFIDYSIRKWMIYNFIRGHFPEENISSIELERTPLGVKIVIHTDNPGRIIGVGGRKINELTDVLKTKFNLENPQIDVKSVKSPYLDAKIVAHRIKDALERGYNYKKIGNIMLKRIMDAGAVGAEIIISGKLGGSKGRTGKFISGYIKKCGQPAKELVDHGFAEAETKPGKIGIKVSIMKFMPSVIEDKEGGETDKKEESKK